MGQDSKPEFGEPLSEEQKIEVKKCLEESTRTIREHQEKQKLEPRLSFIQTAIASGFSEVQAEFLWNNIQIHHRFI